MLCWLQLMQAKKWVAITLLPTGSPLACHHLPIKIYPASYLTEQLHGQSPSRPAVFVQASLRNITVRNASANQGHLARSGARAATKLAGWWGCNLEQAGASGKVWGLQGAHQCPVSGRPKRRGLSLWSFPAAPSNRTSLRPLQGTLLCYFKHNGQKYTAKKLHTQRRKLLLCPGNLDTRKLA